MPPVDVGVYVVTHKDAKLSALPEGYKFIHAEHAIAKNDFGYAGDDTGENISRLNLLIDEAIALYRIWKNISHTHTGFVHYRRFFTNDNTQKLFEPNKILSTEEILNFLSEYDIILNKEWLSERSQVEYRIKTTRSPNLVKAATEIIRKHLAHKHPEYLDAFEETMNDFVMFHYEMFLARRNIFEAYCEWLFSFMIDATEEMLDRLLIGGKKLNELPHDWSRLPGFYVERIMTIRLMKNHVRIKSLPIMLRQNV